MPEKFDLTLHVQADEVSGEGRNYEIEATKAETTALAERFGIVALHALKSSLFLYRNDEKDAFIVSGCIKASLVQQCIVTLTDVTEEIDEEFELMLVSPEVANQLDNDEAYLDPDAPDYDALEGPTIELGEVVAQTLSVMMNPYPKKENVELSFKDNTNVSVNQELEKKPNPFDVLSKLNEES